MPFVRPQVLLAFGEGADTEAERCHRIVKGIRAGLSNKTFNADNLSYRDIGVALGAFDPLDLEGSIKAAGALAHERSIYRGDSIRSEKEIFHESNPGMHTNAFQVITGELISPRVIEGYEGAMGDEGELVTTERATMRNQKISGLTHLPGPLQVEEGHPYSEAQFDEKFVTTQESKKGRILSINEELIAFDQTGEINRRARMLGESLAEERAIAIVNAVTGTDSNVYKPSGTAATLYNTDGSLYNYIGSGNTTSSAYNAAVALSDWEAIATVLKYRWTEVKDDRLEGTARPINGLNSAANVLFVPPELLFDAQIATGHASAVKSTAVSGGVAENMSNHENQVRPYVGRVLTSPYLSAITSANYWYGNFKKEFIEYVIWDNQVFFQGADSESAFDRDVVFRVKARRYSGITAIDPKWVTMIDGA